MVTAEIQSCNDFGYTRGYRARTIENCALKTLCSVGPWAIGADGNRSVTRASTDI